MNPDKIGQVLEVILISFPLGAEVSQVTQVNASALHSVCQGGHSSSAL